jgi:hypothetical protein
MFCDEARFGLIDASCGCWAPAGVRPEIPMKFTRQYLYAYCAVSPVDGKMVSLSLPYANTEAMSFFLREVSSAFPDEYVVLQMDQAGWHKGCELEVPKNVRIAFLPPYSPQLNPVEHVWDELREKWFKNRYFKDLEQVEEQLCKGLKDLEDNPLIVAGITGFPWILKAVSGGD